MHWIYLSPHLDDVALSCGGLVWLQCQEGDSVEVWTLCAGDRPAGPYSPFADELHARWATPGDAVVQRRAEDLAACALMGALPRHFGVPDAIYRRSMDGEGFLYPSEIDVFGPMNPSEADLVECLAADLQRALPEGARLVCPLAVGGHVDHQLVRAAAETLAVPLAYYPDYPYAEQHEAEIDALLPLHLRREITPLPAVALHAWGDAVAAYGSQISTFWEDAAAMRAALEAYHARHGGLRLFVA